MLNVNLLLDYPMFTLLLPFIFTIIIIILLKILGVKRWRCIHLTAQWSALFYVAGVIYLVDQLYNKFILGYVLIIFILFLSFHITGQWRIKLDISLTRAIVLLLRGVFLLFLIIYPFLLVVYGIRIFA